MLQTIQETLTAIWEAWGYLDRRLRNLLRVLFVYIPIFLLVVATIHNSLWPLVASLTVIAVVGLLWSMTVGRNRITTAIIAAGSTSHNAQLVMRRILGLLAGLVLLGIYLTIVPVATNGETRWSVTLLALAFIGVIIGFVSRSFVGSLVGLLCLSIIGGLTYWYVAVIPSEGGPIGIIREVTGVPGPLELCDNQPMIRPEWDTNEVIIQLPGEWDCWGPQVYVPQLTVPTDVTFVGFPLGLDAQGNVICATQSQMDTGDIYQSVHFEWILIDGTRDEGISGDAAKFHGTSRAIPRFRGVGCVRITLLEMPPD